MSYVLKTNYADKSNYGSYRSTSKIKYIVIHYTANDGDTDESNAKYFKRKNIKASAHYFVDDDSVTISVPDTYIAWSVGGSRYANYKITGGAKYYKIATNENTLNIEMCDTIKNGKHDVSEKTLANTIQLVKTLMNKYHIPLSNVIRHFDVTGKSCPSYFVNNISWNNFKNRLINNSSSTKFLHNGIDYSLVFDPTYYANKYADLKNAFGTDANKLFSHFMNNGMLETRQAISTFNVVAYKNKNPDLQKAFGNNFPAYYQHYCQFGYKEGRSAV